MINFIFKINNTNEITRDKSIYFFPWIWCILFFILVPPFIQTELIIILRIILILVLIADYIRRKRLVEGKNIVLLFFLMAFFLEMLKGKQYSFLRNFLIGYDYHHFALVLLSAFYFTTKDRILYFLNIMSFFILITVSFVGFYHVITFKSFWGPNNDFATSTYLQRGRLTGFAFPTSNDVVHLLIIPISFIISQLTQFRKKKFTSLVLFLFYFISLLLTLTRSGYLAFTVVIIFNYILFASSIKKKIVSLLYISIIGIILISLVNLESITPLSLDQSERLSSSGTLETRLNLYSALFSTSSTNFLLGNGISSDASENYWEIAKMYITIHNQYLDWVLTFGLIFTIVVVFYYVKTIKYSYRIIVQNMKGQDYSNAIGLWLALIGVILCEMATTNKYFISLLIIILLRSFIKVKINNDIKTNAL